MGQEFAYWRSFVNDAIGERGSAFLYKLYYKDKVS